MSSECDPDDPGTISDQNEPSEIEKDETKKIDEEIMENELVEKVNVDLFFREPTDKAFELIFTIFKHRNDIDDRKKTENAVETENGKIEDLEVQENSEDQNQEKSINISSSLSKIENSDSKLEEVKPSETSSEEAIVDGSIEDAKVEEVKPSEAPFETTGFNVFSDEPKLEEVKPSETSSEEAVVDGSIEDAKVEEVKPSEASFETTGFNVFSDEPKLEEVKPSETSSEEAIVDGSIEDAKVEEVKPSEASFEPAHAPDSLSKQSFGSNDFPSYHQITTPVRELEMDQKIDVIINYDQFSNDYVPFGTESKEIFPKDDDSISCRSLIAEVGCVLENVSTSSQNQSIPIATNEPVIDSLVMDRINFDDKPEETIRILKVIPSESSIMEFEDLDDPRIIHVPIPLLEPSMEFLNGLVDEIIDEATHDTISTSKSPVPIPECHQLPYRNIFAEVNTIEIASDDPPSPPHITFDLCEKNQSGLTIITDSNGEIASPRSLDDDYEQISSMNIQSMPNSPEQEKPSSILKLNVHGDDDDEASECLDSIGDLSEKTIQRFNTSFDDSSVGDRRDSFSSIPSFRDQQKFRTAIENIRQDLLPFQSSVSQFIESTDNSQLVSQVSMDSPSDLSPNAPPQGIENPAEYFAKLEKNEEIPTPPKDPSSDGSVDSSGFEKVEHDNLDDFNHHQSSDPMQQSIYGFDHSEPSEIMSKDDVIEKNYFDESITAKLLDSPIAEEARRLVQDAVESASDLTTSTKHEIDDIGKELIDNAPIEQAPPAPIHDVLKKADNELLDFVGDEVNLIKSQIEEPAKNVVDDLLDIKEDVVETLKPVGIENQVKNVHNEVDEFLKEAHRNPTPPLFEADEDPYSQPNFGNQTPEEDETTFDRKGPLTIPELPDEQIEEENIGDIPHEAKFESVPRPPTPPKEISDEPVKPSVVNLGPAPTHSHSTNQHHSILKNSGSVQPWVDFKTIDPKVLDLIYWRDPKKSAIALSLSLLALFILGKYPLLSVIAYTGLLILAATLGFRVFKTIEAQIKKTGGENPFQAILSQDLSLPQEKVRAQTDVLVEHANYLANRVKQLIFVESIFDSIKFGLILWSLTYIASWFSGFALIFLTIVGIFSIPKLYETYQEPIDAHLAIVNGHIQNVQNLLEEKIPFLRRPVAAEEKKDQ